MEAFTIIAIFALIIVGVIGLSRTEMFQGIKTKFFSLMTALSGILLAGLPDIIDQVVTPRGFAMIVVGLGITTLISKQVSR